MRRSYSKKVEGNDERREFGEILSQSSKVLITIEKDGDTMMQFFDSEDQLSHTIWTKMDNWDITEYVEE